MVRLQSDRGKRLPLNRRSRSRAARISSGVRWRNSHLATAATPTTAIVMTNHGSMMRPSDQVERLRGSADWESHRKIGVRSNGGLGHRRSTGTSTAQDEAITCAIVGSKASQLPVTLRRGWPMQELLNGPNKNEPKHEKGQRQDNGVGAYTRCEGDSCDVAPKTCNRDDR